MTCREFTNVFASDGLAKGGLLAKLEARLHLLACFYCRRYATQLRIFGRWARQAWGAESQDPHELADLENKILRRLLSESADRRDK